jgi:hypothetical protein
MALHPIIENKELYLMAEEAITTTIEAAEAAAPTETAVETSVEKATPKREPAARKPAARKAPAQRKTAAARTTSAKKAAGEKPAKATRKAAGSKQAAAVESAAKKLAERAQQASRNAFLASLGFYGKAFDQVQEQFNSLQEQIEQRRSQAADLYNELVKRGEKVEAEARVKFDEIEIPSLNELADRKALEAKLQQARERFAELKESIRFKSAA